MVGCGVSCDECGVLLSGAGLPSGSGCGEPTASEEDVVGGVVA